MEMISTCESRTTSLKDRIRINVKHSKKCLQVKACCDVAISTGKCLLFWGQNQASEQPVLYESVAVTTSRINRADDTGQTEERLWRVTFSTSFRVIIKMAQLREKQYTIRHMPRQCWHAVLLLEPLTTVRKLVIYDLTSQWTPRCSKANLLQKIKF